MLFYLQRGTNVNAADSKGRSPLILAAEKGHAEICRILLKAGADPALRDDDGNDALSVATQKGQREVEVILKLHLFSLRNEPEVETTVIGYSADPLSTPADAIISDNELDDASFDRDSFDLSVWEEQTESPTLPGDPYCLEVAGEIQKRISHHIPVDTDADWSDIDIDLPELLAFRMRRGSEKDAVWQTAARNLILTGIHNGWVTEKQLVDAVPVDAENQESPDVEFLRALRVVLGDLGILVEDVPGYLAPFLPPANRVEEDEFFVDRDDPVADEAIIFLLDLQALINDPQGMYVKDIGPKKLLTRKDEIDLFHEILDSTRDACRLIPRSPSAIAEFLNWLDRVEKGDISIRSIIGGGGNPESGENLEPIGQGEIFDGDEAENKAEADECSTGATRYGCPRSPDIPSEILGRITTIQNLCTKMVDTWSSAKRPTVAVRLRDEILALGLSSGFVERFWRTVEHNSLDSETRNILMQSLNRIQSAKIRFAKSNLRLVLSIAWKYRSKLPYMDLVQEGNIGLLKAIDRFDPEHGAKFSTYATWWIRQSITRAIADQARIIRVPVHMIEIINKYENVRQLLTLEIGREPISEEIAERMELTLEKVRRIQSMATVEMVSLEFLTNEEEFGLENVKENGSRRSPLDRASESNIHEVTLSILKTLSRKEEKVLSMRFGFGVHMAYTLEEVGQEINVTRERIRQIEAKALRRLRRPATSKKMRSFLET
ncbi:MAG: sigma-70 family RNA polymerase sigma factor [Magnetococcales bacterium]|nr:sigma-70 family RNA polymerase sigma factor [Magnetococcales bacterium]MBF0420736.1 sigma-70 family RNA polymerase sigma factor [Magnetococcales bacterium]